MQSLACRNNARSLVIVGVIFGALWLGGLAMQIAGATNLGSDGLKVLGQQQGDVSASAAYSHGLLFVIGSVLSSVGFLALVIGMPILGSMRYKMRCDM